MDKLENWIFLVFSAVQFLLCSELSVFDLLGDDGPNESLQENPKHEAHVAFAIEGTIFWLHLIFTFGYVV